MDTLTKFTLLKDIRTRWDDRQSGEIFQRLLELAFSSADYRLLEERLVEGIDFDVQFRSDPAIKYTFEARTTQNLHVPVKDEDLRQMDLKSKDGYSAGVAALAIAPGSEWVFVPRIWLLPPTLRISVGSMPPWDRLASEINFHFEGVLEALGSQAYDYGLDGLQQHIAAASL